jgi:hypothetical protein
VKKTTCKAVLIAALGISLAPGPAAAFQPLITDDTGTQGAGGNQLEGSLARTNDKLPAGTSATRAAAAVTTRGMTDELDVFLGLTHQRSAPAGAAAESGWSNPALGAKWRFHDDDKSKLSFALRPELQLPVSRGKEARGLGQADTSWRLDLLMTKETGFGAVHANLASSRVNFDDGALDAATRRSQYRLSVAPVWDLTGEWKLALDGGIMTNPDRTESTRMGYVELGAIYSPSKDLDFALGVIRNVDDGPVKSTQVTAGVTWRFK